MDSQIEVRGTLGVAPTKENTHPPTYTFQEVKVYQGSLPKTNQLSESNFMLLGLILCLMVIVLRELRKLSN